MKKRFIARGGKFMRGQYKYSIKSFFEKEREKSFARETKKHSVLQIEKRRRMSGGKE